MGTPFVFPSIPSTMSVLTSGHSTPSAIHFHFHKQEQGATTGRSTPSRVSKQRYYILLDGVEPPPSQPQPRMLTSQPSLPAQLSTSRSQYDPDESIEPDNANTAALQSVRIDCMSSPISCCFSSHCLYTGQISRFVSNHNPGETYHGKHPFPTYHHYT
jgi:hypothetical protein